jgi:hypothetical protein
VTPGDVDGLIAVLDEEPAGPLPPRLGELLAVAAELAEALTAKPLPSPLRRRMYRRALEQAEAPRQGLADIVRRHSRVGAASGVAALAAAVVAVALLRGREHHPGVALPA